MARKLNQLRTGAQPGPSGSRNGHLQCLARCPWGLDALLGWCRLWAEGKMPAGIAHYFTDAKVRPIAKEDGGVRPIALIEALYKVASGCIQQALREQGGEGLGPDEYCGLPGGAETMVLTGRGGSSA